MTYRAAGGGRVLEESAVVGEIREIQRRLAAMVGVGEEGHGALGEELERIRADLRRLAADHEEVKKRLAPMLWAASSQAADCDQGPAGT